MTVAVLLALGACGGGGGTSTETSNTPSNPVLPNGACAPQVLSWTVSGNTCTATSVSTTSGSVATLQDVTGPATGSAMFTCTNGSWSAAANALCSTSPASADVSSVELSPAMDNVNPGATLQLTATLKDASGTVLTGRAISWTTSNASSVGVSSTGLVSGVATGSATITASSEGKTASAIMTVPTLLTGAATAGDWLTFTLNVQDFAYPDRSATTVDRVITLHESYRMPVDIYLTDTMLASFEANYPALMTRLRSSPYVALNYHIRPPKPYYTGYDWAGLSNLPATEQLGQIRAYESHVTDLVTGQPGSAAGGFMRLKQLTGSSPVIAAFQADAALYAPVSQVFRELGASMAISHSAPYINLGTTASGLSIRPEHFDLKLFESPGQSASSLIDSAFATAHTTSGAASPYVVGVKMHDNDFFALASAWTNTYVNAPRRPPWNITTLAGLKSDASMQAQWTLYEAAVAWADSNRSRVAAANAKGLGAALAAAPAMPLLYVSGTMHIESTPARWPNPDSLMAFFQRAVNAGKAGSQTSGMRWSIGADIGWLSNESRAGEVIRTLSALGVEWDVHVHSAADRAAAAQRIVALGGTPTSVLSGVMVSDLDTVRSAMTGTGGYAWQAGSLWGLVRTGSHSAGSEDLSSGLWQPRSNSDWQAHDPAKSLVAVGGGARSLAGVESLATQLVSGYTAPVYSATVMVDSYTLTVSDAANASTSSDGINQIEGFASRLGARSNVRWATPSGTAAAWRAAGSLPSRIASTQ